VNAFELYERVRRRSERESGLVRYVYTHPLTMGVAEEAAIVEATDSMGDYAECVVVAWPFIVAAMSRRSLGDSGLAHGDLAKRLGVTPESMVCLRVGTRGSRLKWLGDSRACLVRASSTGLPSETHVMPCVQASFVSLVG
jgi:hypothetical protein